MRFPTPFCPARQQAIYWLDGLTAFAEHELTRNTSYSSTNIRHGPTRQGPGTPPPSDSATGAGNAGDKEANNVQSTDHRSKEEAFVFLCYFDNLIPIQSLRGVFR